MRNISNLNNVALTIKNISEVRQEIIKIADECKQLCIKHNVTFSNPQIKYYLKTKLNV